MTDSAHLKEVSQNIALCEIQTSTIWRNSRKMFSTFFFKLLACKIEGRLAENASDQDFNIQIWEESLAEGVR